MTNLLLGCSRVNLLNPKTYVHLHHAVAGHRINTQLYVELTAVPCRCHIQRLVVGQLVGNEPCMCKWLSMTAQLQATAHMQVLASRVVTM